jgi:predicted permease
MNDWLRQIRFRVRALFRRRDLEAEMAEEMRAHLEFEADARRAQGAGEEQARTMARRAFGGAEQMKERCRDELRFMWLEQIGQDVRYAIRALVKAPSFTITAVLTLAFGIGVNAALFTVYNVVALRPLPVRDPDGLVKITGADSRRGGYYPRFSYGEYLAYCDGTQTLTAIAAINDAVTGIDGELANDPDKTFEIRGPGTVPVQYVSDNYFEVLGAEMKLGRGFRPEENSAPGREPVIVLSHLFWQSRLHSDPNVLGRTIVLNRPYTVIGVTAPEFSGQQPAPPAGWIPAMMWGRAADYGPRSVAAFQLIGRMKPGVTEQQAKVDLDVIATRWARDFPSPEGNRDLVRLERGLKFVSIPMNARTLAALGPVILGFFLVLIIACTNVANLLLARGVTRQQEIGMRLTLGASRGRMIRQLFTENLLLSAVGAAVGLALAVWTLQLLQPMILGRLPADWMIEARRWYFLEMGPDWRVAGFTAGLTLIAALAAGLLPAMQAAHTDLVTTLKNEGTGFGRKLSQSRLRSLLVISQVAICLTLLSCAGLLARNLFALRQTDVGFDPRQVFNMIGAARSKQPFDRAAVEAVAATLRTLPGVAAATTAADAPLSSRGGTTALVKLADAPERNGAVEKIRAFRVSGELFETFGITLARGRGFERGDMEPGARAIVLSEALARRWWPNGDALGKTVAINDMLFAGRAAPAGAETWREFEVVGVARDVLSRVEDTERLLIYLPFAMDDKSRALLFARPRGDSPAALEEIVRDAGTKGIDVRFNRRMSDFLEEQMLPYHGLAVLSGGLGALALLMASVGLYGVMAFAVSQRTREIGIRVALGATGQRVVALFVRQGMKLVAVGLGLGVLGGLGFARLLAKILYGIGGAFDPMAFGAVTLLFGVIAMFACWLPARRATKVDPMVALRAE